MPVDTSETLEAQLASFRSEHRTLDQRILALHTDPLADELLLRRLKKHKLALKDQITMLERQLEPDTYA